MSTHASLPARASVPVAQTCDLAAVFPSPEAWEREWAALGAELPALAAFRGRLGGGAACLADWFAASEGWQRRYGRLAVYAGMAHALDTADEAAAAREARAGALGGRAAEALAFAEPEILALGAETIDDWLGREPRLADHAHALRRLERRRPHLRGPEVEELLGGLVEPFHSASAVHGVLADADLRFAPARDAAGVAHEVAQGTIGDLLAEPDRELRRTAWENYADAHLAHRHAMAACLATGVRQHVLLARTRRYDSALEAALDPNDIPTAVFHNVLDAFRRHLPTWHRYWRVRRRALGVPRLREYDVRAPLVARAPRVDYAQAVEWIAAGMAPLGAEYVAALRAGAGVERWVDRCPNQGKRSGAFSWGVPGAPPFICMSWSDDLYSLSTLAHELGHSLHSLYAERAQPYVYADYSIFVAEVASNFNQALVRAHLLGLGAGREFEIAVLEEAMANFHRYFFLMPTLARLELELHERIWRGEALTAGAISGLLADLFAEGYGGEVEMDRERSGITWAQFHTHLYANFYVYQYATGIAAAHVLAEGVRAGGPEAAARYLDFLRAGGSLYPLPALRRAGVDLLDASVVEAGFQACAHTVERLEALVGTGGR